MSNNRANSFINRNFPILFYAGLLIGLLLALLYSHHQILTGDQTQMLQKGYIGAYQGVWSSFGNAASAVGNVPGSLSAYLVGMPLIIWDSPWAPMLLLLFLRLLSFFLFDMVIKKIFSPDIRLSFLILYWLNPWFLFESLLYNPSYLLFFAALHFYSAFRMREERSFVYSFLHLLSIGMAMQLHYSWPILAVISGYLFYRKIIKVDWPGIMLASIFTLASLIPYFQELLVNENLVRNPGNKDGERYIGWGGVHLYPVFKAFLYWLRYASLLFTNKLITGAQFDWISSPEYLQTAFVYIWRAVLFLLGGLSLWFAWRAHRYAWGQIRSLILPKEMELSLEKWMLLYVAGAFIGVTVSAILSPILFSYWHLIIIFPFALFPILVFINNMKVDVSRYLMSLSLYFIAVNLIAAHDSTKFSHSSHYSQQVLHFVEVHHLVKTDNH